MSINIGTADFKSVPTNPQAKITGVHESLLQDSEKDIIWYRENFFGKEHANFLAYTSPKGPLAVSIIKEGDTFKALVRTSNGSERLALPSSEVQPNLMRKMLRLRPAYLQALSKMSESIPVKSLKPARNPQVSNDLLAMEERQVIRSYKFGVGYLAAGQSTEAEMVSNTMEKASPAFKSFLQFLGETIELKGWKGYRAGLDVANDTTGTHSVYTKWQGYEIMYHVSTLLPYNTTDSQQIERKRHIGNDIVVIVFQDEENAQPFQLPTLTSQQNHVIAVVRPQGDQYQLAMASRTGVPDFTPELPEPCVFGKDAIARDFFLHKLVNAERASYKAPAFAPKISRTREILIQEVALRS